MVILRGAVKPVAWQPTGVFLSFAGQEVSKKSPGNPYLNLNDPSNNNKYVPIVSFSWWGFWRRKIQVGRVKPPLPIYLWRTLLTEALLSEAGVPMDRRFTFFDQVPGWKGSWNPRTGAFW